MTQTTMLQLVQQATAEMGLAVPTFVAGNTAQDTIQQLALLNAVGYELYRQHLWQAFTEEYRFTTEYLITTGDVIEGSYQVINLGSTDVSNTATAPGVTTAGNQGQNAAVVGNAGTNTLINNTYQISGTGINQDVYVVSRDSATQITMSQAATQSGVGVQIIFGKVKYAYPVDFDSLVDRTQWDKSKHWEMLGPETPQQWQWLKSGYISTGPRIRFRPVQGYFQIWPMVTTNEILGFEYRSTYWAYNFAGAGKNSFTVDTDTCAFPDRLMVLGLKLKYFEIKGFDTTALYRDYRRELDIAMANDAGSPTLSFAPRISTILIGFDQVPDSNYGS